VLFYLIALKLCVSCVKYGDCDYQHVRDVVIIQGRIQDFKLGEGALKKLRRAEGGANIFGVFRVKNHDFTPKNLIFSNFRGGSAPVIHYRFHARNRRWRPFVLPKHLVYLLLFFCVDRIVFF
jgi:hypothetical protein